MEKKKEKEKEVALRFADTTYQTKRPYKKGSVAVSEAGGKTSSKGAGRHNQELHRDLRRENEAELSKG